MGQNQKAYHIRWQNGKSKSLLVCNEFKCKWVKLTNKKTEISKMDLRKKQDLTVDPQP